MGAGLQSENQSFYAAHLSEVNKTTAVLSTEDIVTDKGMVLAKKGQRINHDLASKLLQHKLLKPIEEQVSLDNTLRPADIEQRYETLFTKFPDLSQIHTAHEFEQKLNHLLNNLDINEILEQKLTVLSIRLPEVFEKSIFCAWLCALIAQEMQLDETQTHEAFIAALFHDIGLIHVDPDILNKKEQLSAGEWRAIQSHVVTGYLIFTQVKSANKNIARAIIEHHECSDGTGYPKGLMAEQLSLTGQILAMADSIQAVRVNHFANKGRNLRDALSFLHMNSSKTFLPIYKTMCLIILNSKLPANDDHSYCSYEELVAKLLERIDKLQDAIVVLRLISELTQQTQQSIQYKKLLCVLDPVIKIIITSGMVRDELIVWLKGLRLNRDDKAMRDLNEMDVMQDELFWQLKKAVRVTNEYMEKTDILKPNQKEHLKKLTDYIYSSLENNIRH